MMRALTGVGTPKGLQGRFAGVLDRMRGHLAAIRQLMNAATASRTQVAGIFDWVFMRTACYAAA